MGSNRNRGDSMPGQAARTDATRRSGSGGSAARKCSGPGTRPRPGRSVGTVAATLRSTSESTGSPSRSSRRVPSWSRRAARKSDHRAADATRWMPRPRPRSASCCSVGSSWSNSARNVPQPSTHRNTSPYPSSPRPASRSSAMSRTCATIRRTTSPSARPAMPATCGRSRRGASAPPRSSTNHWVRSGLVVSAVAARIVRSSVLLPLRGPPTTATCPPAPARSSTSGSRRCSRGRSTVPTGICSGPCAADSSRSTESGRSSGGSQIRWAAGPRSRIRSTASSRTEGRSFVVVVVARRRPPVGRRRGHLAGDERQHEGRRAAAAPYRAGRRRSARRRRPPGTGSASSDRA